MIAELRWGLFKAVPEDATSAWGCRAIITQNGDLDILPDRVDRQGTEAVFALLAAEFPISELRRAIEAKLSHFEMDTRVAGQVTLHESDALTVVADTKGSAGYCYIAAWTTTQT